MKGFILKLLLLSFFILFALPCFSFPNDCIVINIPSRTLDLFKNGKLLKTFPVGVGRPEFPTPIGVFKVIRLVKNPGWENPYKPYGEIRLKAGKENPLGTRWIGFKPHKDGEYGIHGTDDPASVGKYASHGCIRMKVKDAEDVFSKVSIGTPVIVTYETSRITVSSSKVFVTNYPDAYKKGKSTLDSIKNSIKNLNLLVIWNASTAVKAINVNNTNPIKIGTIIEESDFF